MSLRQLEPVKAPVCGVFAAALATDLPFATVMEKAREIKKNPGGWRGRLYLHELYALLRCVGVQFTKLEGFRGMTLAKVAAELDPDRQHIVFITGHYLTLYQGKAYDQHFVEGKPIGEYRLRGSRTRVVLKLK